MPHNGGRVQSASLGHLPIRAWYKWCNNYIMTTDRYESLINNSIEEATSTVEGLMALEWQI